MSAHEIGLLSGVLVALSFVPYAIRVGQGKIRPVPTTWLLWSLIGLAILLTYRSSGAEENVWPAVFGFVNPTLVTVLCVWRKGKWEKPSALERMCFILGIVALVAWWFVRQDRELSLYALCLAIAADLCAAIPTFNFFRREPEGDRPFAWFFFAVGYALTFFAIPEPTVANYVLPIYMTAGSTSFTLLLVIPRIRRGIPLREWI